MALTTRVGLQEPPHFLEKKVRFSFSRCDVKKYCVTKLQRVELEKFYSTMGKFEKMTWQQFRSLPREHGLSIDKEGSPVRDLLQIKVPSCTTFGHFRVNGVDTNPRIFVGISDDLAYITLIDREGRLQH